MLFVVGGMECLVVLGRPYSVALNLDIEKLFNTRGNVEHCGASVSKRCTTALTVM